MNNKHGFELHGSTYLFFSTVNTTVLHDLWLVESTDAEPLIWRNCLYRPISYTWISHCSPDPHVVQWSIVLDFLCCNGVAVTSIFQLLRPSLVSPTPDILVPVKALFLISNSLKYTWQKSFSLLSQEPVHSPLPHSSWALTLCQVPLQIFIKLYRVGAIIITFYREEH